MVCSKCQKLTKGTTLATPEVKKKSEMYYGSPASSSKGADKKSVTLANAGVTKSKLLSKSAKNPYAHLAHIRKMAEGQSNHCPATRVDPSQQTRVAASNT
ncbi:hypothetical protein SAPIO_CDS2923 [Scedosporium apiospermum]|uniref:Cysteine-rich interactor of PDZ three n=1 Tax=Pseudallescheria apiosperma TaxID=563466 RepID=A0A084GBU8_PSEDA|nr:uncharacterized protein SAPIO_CDS2923 [Scedosporium apiospermum]KEZ44810.1 hypothetical protein SAPIO_CDS2923 [Scedosporium apiospermum]